MFYFVHSFMAYSFQSVYLIAIIGFDTTFAELC